MALLAALGWAVAAAITKRLKGVAPQLIALIHVTTGSLMLAPLVDWSSLPQGNQVWAVLATIGVVHTGIMYALMYAGVQRLPTDLQGALSFIYPVVAIVIDVAALGPSCRPSRSSEHPQWCLRQQERRLAGGRRGQAGFSQAPEAPNDSDRRAGAPAC